MSEYRLSYISPKHDANLYKSDRSNHRAYTPQNLSSNDLSYKELKNEYAKVLTYVDTVRQDRNVYREAMDAAVERKTCLKLLGSGERSPFRSTGKIVSTINKCSDSDRRVVELEQEVSELRKLLEAQTKRIAILQCENQDYQEKIKDLKVIENSNKQLYVDMKSLDHEIGTITKQMQDLERENKRLMKEISIKKSETIKDLQKNLMKYGTYIIHLLTTLETDHFGRFCFDERFSSEKDFLKAIEGKQRDKILLQSFRYIADLLLNINSTSKVQKDGQACLVDLNETNISANIRKSTTPKGHRDQKWLDESPATRNVLVQLNRSQNAEDESFRKGGENPEDTLKKGCYFVGRKAIGPQKIYEDQRAMYGYNNDKEERYFEKEKSIQYYNEDDDGSFSREGNMRRDNKQYLNQEATIPHDQVKTTRDFAKQSCVQEDYYPQSRNFNGSIKNTQKEENRQFVNNYRLLNNERQQSIETRYSDARSQSRAENSKIHNLQSLVEENRSTRLATEEASSFHEAASPAYAAYQVKPQDVKSGSKGQILRNITPPRHNTNASAQFGQQKMQVNQEYQPGERLIRIDCQNGGSIVDQQFKAPQNCSTPTSTPTQNIARQFGETTKANQSPKNNRPNPSYENEAVATDFQNNQIAVKQDKQNIQERNTSQKGSVSSPSLGQKRAEFDEGDERVMTNSEPGQSLQHSFANSLREQQKSPPRNSNQSKVETGQVQTKDKRDSSPSTKQQSPVKSTVPQNSIKESRTSFSPVRSTNKLNSSRYSANTNQTKLEERNLIERENDLVQKIRQLREKEKELMEKEREINIKSELQMIQAKLKKRTSGEFSQSSQRFGAQKDDDRVNDSFKKGRTNSNTFDNQGDYQDYVDELEEPREERPRQNSRSPKDYREIPRSSSLKSIRKNGENNQAVNEFDRTPVDVKYSQDFPSPSSKGNAEEDMQQYDVKIRIGYNQNESRETLNGYTDMPEQYSRGQNHDEERSPSIERNHQKKLTFGTEPNFTHDFTNTQSFALTTEKDENSPLQAQPSPQTRTSRDKGRDYPSFKVSFGRTESKFKKSQSPEQLLPSIIDVPKRKKRTRPAQTYDPIKGILVDSRESGRDGNSRGGAREFSQTILSEAGEVLKEVQDSEKMLVISPEGHSRKDSYIKVMVIEQKWNGGDVKGSPKKIMK